MMLKQHIENRAAQYRALRAAGLPDLTDDANGFIHDAVSDAIDKMGLKPVYGPVYGSDDEEFTGELQGPDGEEILGAVGVSWTCEEPPTLELPIAVTVFDVGQYNSEATVEAHLLTFKRSPEPVKVLWTDPKSRVVKSIWVYHCSASFQVENER